MQAQVATAPGTRTPRVSGLVGVQVGVQVAFYPCFPAPNADLASLAT